MANLIAQSNVALAETLAHALQGLRPAPVPTIKLGRFMGYPQRSGDPTLADWLDDFFIYARQLGVSGDDRTVVLLDHLGGCAKEEVLCHPLAMRQSMKSLTALLRSRFGPLETVHSLQAGFHARMQLEGESLAEYSRVLMILHDRIEKAAATLAERQALTLLRDNALKEQFAQGVRQQSVRQELRRLALASVGRPFFQMRDEALLLLREDEEPMRVRTTCVDQVQSAPFRSPLSKVPVPSDSVYQPLLSQLLQTEQQLQQQMLQLMSRQKQLHAQVMQLSSQQNEMTHQLRAVLDRCPQGHATRPISVPVNIPSHRDGLCFFCKHKGHFIRDCPRKRELNAIQSHKNRCAAEKHVKKLQEENDHLKETLEKMTNTNASDLNERETKSKREIHQLTCDLQRASKDARALNMQLMTLKAKSPKVVTRIERVEVESETCKLALEKCSTSLEQSQKEARCLRSQLTALGNKYQDVKQRLTKATEHDAHLQLVSRDHDELTERLRLLESDSVDRNDQLNDSDTVLQLANPCPNRTTDDRVASQTMTSHAVRRSSWANRCSHSNPAHFPMAG